MKKIVNRNRAKQARNFALQITVTMLIVLSYFIIERQFHVLSEDGLALSGELSSAFNTNEVIADSISIKLYGDELNNHCNGDGSFLKYMNNSGPVTVYSTEKSGGSGMLRTEHLTSENICIYKAGEFVKKWYADEHNLKGHRYIVSSNFDYIYFFNKVPVSELKLNLPFILDKRKGIDFTTGFFSRKLNPDLQGDNSTDFYVDQISGEKTFSIISPIYHVINNKAVNPVVGYLLYDHDKYELLHLLEMKSSNTLKKGYYAKIINIKNGDSLCFYGECINSPFHSLTKSSSRYTVDIGLSYYGFLYNPMVIFSAIFSTLFFFFIKKAILLRLNHADNKGLLDELTKTYNRKALDYFNNGINECYYVIIIDCNKFKQINDTYGHGTGDEALKIITHIMRKCIRSNDDFIIRLGGDEFLLVIGTDNFSIANEIAFRISNKIEMNKFNVRGNRVELSISYGIAKLDNDLDQAINSADVAMYEMKHKS